MDAINKNSQINGGRKMPNQSMQKKDKISVLLKYFTDGTADDDRDILLHIRFD